MSAIEQFRSTLIGRPCLAVALQSYTYRGELVDPVNVVFLKFDERRWARFGIDAGHFFWREVTEPDVPESSEEYQYPLTDVGPSLSPVLNRPIDEVVLSSQGSDRTALLISFVDAPTLALTNSGDRTRLGISEPVV